MKEVSYLAVFAPQAEGGWTATFPDVPGAITEGEELPEAYRSAREALELILEARAEQGEPLPERSSDEALAARHRKDGVIALITALAPSKAVRINVTIDEGLLGRLNRYVETKGRTRSAVIGEAVRKLLKDVAA